MACARGATEGTEKTTAFCVPGGLKGSWNIFGNLNRERLSDNMSEAKRISVLEGKEAERDEVLEKTWDIEDKYAAEFMENGLKNVMVKKG